MTAQRNFKIYKNKEGDHANDSTAININMEKQRKKCGLENLNIYSFLRKEII